MPMHVNEGGGFHQDITASLAWPERESRVWPRETTSRLGWPNERNMSCCRHRQNHVCNEGEQAAHGTANVEEGAR